MSNKKKAAPKRSEGAPTTEPKNITVSKAAPKNSKPNESKEDVKALKKAEKANKKNNLEIDYDHVLHLHPFRFFVDFLIFIAVSILLYVAISILMGITVFGATVTLQDGNSAEFIVGLIVVIGFMIWMSLFQLGIRRIFRIGRNERILKEIERLEQRNSKLQKKRNK